jgi:dienelactone hydrolase
MSHAACGISLMFSRIIYVVTVKKDMPEKNELVIPLEKLELPGDLTIPEKGRNIVIFAHGSGSSRHSPRNRMVADYLVQHGLGTLLFDLLTPAEDRDYSNRFNIELLAKRLINATEWVQSLKETQGMYFSYFGASTGAAAALMAAGAKPQTIAVVSRGGRPDLAMESLASVKSPTLLIVGSLDTDVLQLNLKAIEKIQVEKELKIIPGASHLFEEAGTMNEVCRLSTEWFLNHPLPPV